MAQNDLEFIYNNVSADRDRHTEDILESDAPRKVVVAGPGTGKTTLFAKLLSLRSGKALTLSFINALVDELAFDLYGLSDVRTLHGYSTKVLHGQREAKIYPKLPQVIAEDAVILLGKEGIDYREIFRRYEEDEELIPFYKERKDYYGKYYGFDDVIYAAAKYFEANPNRIPTYDQIIVDEFQDFNNSEVRLIELLASLSPILLAGDDDQSLYVDLKNASPDHIREKYHDTESGYARFTLPYCSRCTKVIVEAANDIVNSAKARGLLEGRVSKQFSYFQCKEKDEVSDLNSKIIHRQKHDAQIPYFITKEIEKIAKHEKRSLRTKSQFDILIIIPPRLRTRLLPKMAKALAKKGFRKVIHSERSPVKEPTLLDGLNIILKSNNENDNLGYRIAARNILNLADFEALLRNCTGDEKVKDHLDAYTRRKIDKFLKVLRRVRDNKDQEVEKEELDEFLKGIDLDPYKLATDAVRDQLLADDDIATDAHRAIREIPITLTTIPGSKGLSGDYVFITHFDDKHVLHDKDCGISDADVYALLVALTRARKKCFLISTAEETPSLLDLIDASRIDQQLG